ARAPEDRSNARGAADRPCPGAQGPPRLDDGRVGARASEGRRCARGPQPDAAHRRRLEGLRDDGRDVRRAEGRLGRVARDARVLILAASRLGKPAVPQTPSPGPLRGQALRAGARRLCSERYVKRGKYATLWAVWGETSVYWAYSALRASWLRMRLPRRRRHSFGSRSSAPRTRRGPSPPPPGRAVTVGGRRRRRGA